MKLAYQYWGPRDESGQMIAPNFASNTRLVLLHGMGGTGALWRPIAANLEDDISILAPDQRGHGKSRLPSEISDSYTPLDYGQDVIDTLSDLPFHPTWILGHSMGVRTAVAAAHLKPEWVKGLILVDLGFAGAAGGGLGDNLSSFLKRLPDQFNSRTEARDFMIQNCPDPSIGQYLMAVSTLNSSGKVSFPFDHSALIQTIETARGTSLREWLQDLGSRGMPILALRGAQSKVWSHEDFEKERANFSHFNSIVFKEVEGTGHGLPFEKRAEFVQIVRQFCG